MSASNAKSSANLSTTDRELVIKRVFNAPRELMFAVWTDPKHVVQWWGPNGFSTTVQEMDVRPGGLCRYSMRSPDGHDYPFDGHYLEVVKPERLVSEGTIHGVPSQVVWTEVTFAEQEGHAKVTVRQVYSFESAATRGAPIGWNQQLDRLTAYLTKV